MTKVFTSKTAAETQELAKRLLLDIVNKKVVLLNGQLGSGKTTFVKGLAKALGIETVIKSPTYTYVNSYPLRTTNYELRTLHHFDLYRLPETSENPAHTAASIGLTDALNDPESIVVIEWPERLPLDTPALHLHFEKRQHDHQILLTT